MSKCQNHLASHNRPKGSKSRVYSIGKYIHYYNHSQQTNNEQNGKHSQHYAIYGTYYGKGLVGGVDGWVCGELGDRRGLC